MCSTLSFLQLRNCNCLGLGLGTSGHGVQVHLQEWHEDVEDLLRESFCEMVRNVESAGNVFDAEMALADSVGKPEISHVHTLGSFLIELVVGKPKATVLSMRSRVGGCG